MTNGYWHGLDKKTVYVSKTTHTKKLIQTEMRIKLPCGSVKHKTENKKKTIVSEQEEIIDSNWHNK
jgi:signal recognition particle receptor subunit beta